MHILQVYYVKIKTKEGVHIGQFGYRVIDKSARRNDPWMSEGGVVTHWYNLPLRFTLSERGGDVSIIT